MRPRYVISPDNKCQIYCQYYLGRSGQQGGSLNFYEGGSHQYGGGIGNILLGIGRRLLPSVLPIVAKGASTLIDQTVDGLNSGEGFGEALKGALLPTGKTMLRSLVGGQKRTKRRKQRGKGLDIPKKRKPRPKRLLYKPKRTLVRNRNSTRASSKKVAYTNF